MAKCSTCWFGPRGGGAGGGEVEGSGRELTCASSFFRKFSSVVF